MKSIHKVYIIIKKKKKKLKNMLKFDVLHTCVLCTCTLLYSEIADFI